MAQFQTNPWKLADLLARMDSCKVVLPEFQRSFVWRPSDIDLLLTSLVLDFPAGSLLFLRADPRTSSHGDRSRGSILRPPSSPSTSSSTGSSGSRASPLR